MPPGHLHGKDWPLGSRVRCLIVKLSLSHWYPGSVWCLIVSIPDLCPLSYFDKFDRSGMCSSTTKTTKELSISLFMCFRIFNFGQIKMIFFGDENFKKLVHCKCKCL